MDAYDALVSGAPTDKETQLAMAQQLRDQSNRGRLLEMTGDKMLSPVGHQMQQQAMTQAQGISTEREKQASLAQALAEHQDTVKYQQGELANRQQGLDQSMKIAQMTDTRDRAQQGQQASQFQQTLADRKRHDDQEDAARISLQQEKANEKAAAALDGGKPVPDGEFQKLSAFKDVVNSVGDAKNGFQSSYGGTGLPGGRKADNWMAQNIPGIAGSVGLINQNDKAASNWYQNYGRNFTMDEMHNKFGARLSPAEIAIFESNHINPNMDGPTIASNLEQIQTKAKQKLNERVQALAAAGYNKAELRQIMADADQGLPTPQATPTAAPAPVPATHTMDSVLAEAAQRVAAKKAAAAQAAPPTSMNFPQATAAPAPGPQNINSVLQGLPMGQMG